MIDRAGDPVILDFGIALFTAGASVDLPGDDAYPTGARVVGTLHYASPEQLGAQPVGPASDVFSFGVTLYEMLRGVRPFGGSEAPGLLAGFREAPPLGDDVPVALSQVVARCLQKDPAARYATGRELLAALDEVPVEVESVVSARRPDVGVDPTPDLASADTVALEPPRGGAPKIRSFVRPAIALAIAAMGATAIGVAMRVSPPSGSTAAPAASSSTAAPPTAPLTLADRPPLATTVPEAAHEYAAGMQALRDDNWDVALQHFDRVTQLDPSMAAGHMRVAMVNLVGDPERRRVAFREALARRAQLDARDQALLEALEPLLLRTKPDRAEARRRVEAMVKLRPSDVELYTWASVLAPTPEEALAASERSTLLDPKDGNGWEGKGHALESLGRVAEARDAYDRCAAVVTVGNADCTVWAANAEMVLGRCEEFERKARRAADMSPLYGAFEVAAMVANARPDSAVQARIKQVEAKIGPFAPIVGPLGPVAETSLALIGGDFARARVLARKEAAAIAADPATRADYGAAYAFAMFDVEASLEAGDTASAQATARDFVARALTLTQTDPLRHGVDLVPYLQRLAFPAEHDFQAARQAWLDAHASAGATPGDLWVYGRAASVLGTSEASAALALLPASLPITPLPVSFVFHGNGLPDAYAGHVHLLAGKSDEALPYLRRASASCTVFFSAFALMRAKLDLGIALEQTDRAGACAAYGQVVDRWGHAKPRSVTADEARVRARKLGCEGR